MKKEPEEEPYERPPNAFQGVGDRGRLSERTVRNAFSRKPITWGTAQTLSHVLKIPMGCFRIKEDMRGRNKNRKQQDQ